MGEARLIAITLDEASIERGTPEQEHERAIAIYDLVEENRFGLPGHGGGPYALHLGLISGRLAFDIREENGTPVITHLLSLSPFRKAIKDYFLICESYYEAIRTASPDRTEAIDMGRRGVHDEGAGIVMERLVGKIEIDQKTARRLFTLIVALSWKDRTGEGRVLMEAAAPVQSVLFICSLNAVRSPMAEALAHRRFGKRLYVDSAGLRKSERDGFALAVLREIDIDFSDDEPHTLDEVDCEAFDLVIALSREAHQQAQERLRATAVELLYWPIEDATEVSGTREQRLFAYRAVRDRLDEAIRREIAPRLGG